MPLVIAGGPSVTDYPLGEVRALAAMAFTFAVNESALLFPCDVVVSLDPELIEKRKADFAQLGRPIVTRKWEGNGKLGLDLIELDNDVVEFARYSGMAACKLADRLACQGPDRKSYVLGMDATQGHYKEHPNKGGQKFDQVAMDAYERLNLERTVNLSRQSKISCWPKLTHLPSWKKVITSPTYKALAIAWLRTKGNAEIYHGVTK